MPKPQVAPHFNPAFFPPEGAPVRTNDQDLIISEYL